MAWEFETFHYNLKSAELFASVGDCGKIESVWTARMQELMEPFVQNVATNLQDGLNVVVEEMRLKKEYVEEGKRKFAVDRGIPIEDLLPNEIERIEKNATLRVMLDLGLRSLRGKDRLVDQRNEHSKRFRKILEEELPKDWSADAPKVYVTALKKRGRQTRRFLLNDMTAEQRLDAIAASSAVSAMFESVKIDGVEYVDGGVGRGSDNTPIGPVLEQHPEIRTLVVVYLDDEKRLDDQRLRNVHGRRIIEIIPSQDSHGLLGCLNSNPERARKLIELGYRDAMRKLAHKVP